MIDFNAALPFIQVITDKPSWVQILRLQCCLGWDGMGMG